LKLELNNSFSNILSKLFNACRNPENNRTDRGVLNCKYSDRIFTVCRNAGFHKPYSSRPYFTGKNKHAKRIVTDRRIREKIINVVDYYL